MRRAALLPYFIVVFLGYVGFSMPMPILPEMFLDTKRSILSPSMSIEEKTLILSLVFVAYPLGQFFGCPVLGRLSDLWGRRRIILISLLGNALGYIITALSVHANSIMGIFSGLLFCGFSEGNIALAQAVIADVTERDKKMTSFGWLNFFASLGFILGPLMGGFLADPKNYSQFTFATPFWAALAMTLLSFGIVYGMSKETHFKGVYHTGFIEAFKTSWKLPNIRKIFIASFFFYMAGYAFWRYFPVFLERKFDFSSSGLAYAIAYESLFWALTFMGIGKLFAKIQRPVKAVAWFVIGFGAMLVISVFPSSFWHLIWMLPLFGVFQAIAVTMFSVFISDLSSKEVQGQAMGSLQSIQVFAGLVMVLAGGALCAWNVDYPLFLGALMTGICGIILYKKLTLRKNGGSEGEEGKAAAAL